MKRTKIEQVLVVVKPGQRGLPPAAHHGRVLADRLGARVTILSVIHDSPVAMRLGLGRGGAAEARQGMIDAEQARLAQLADSMRDWGIAVETEVSWHQPPYEAIVQAARQRGADLIALDVIDPSTLHTRLTDTDWQLMRHAPCPVLYVNSAEVASYADVLAAVDPMHVGELTDEIDRAVLSLAGEFGRAFEAALRIVHAYPDPEGYGWVSAVQVSPGVFFGTENLEQAHRLAVEELAREVGIEPASIDIRAGEPADVIVDTATERGAGLIVLGAMARGGLEQALLGSTAETVAAEANCDVLLVKPTAAAG